MKIKSNIDLSESFERLKNGLASCDKMASKPNGNLGNVYHHLAGFVEAHIKECEDKEGETLLDRDANDIPDSMFRQ